MNRHRITATVLSIASFGLGQLYNRQYLKGMLLLTLEAAGLTYFINNMYHAIWGFVTLGKVPVHMEKINGINVRVGDHSITLMLEGLIAFLVLILFIYVYILNIRDANSTGEKRDKGFQPATFVQSIKYVMDRRFPEMFLALPIIGVLFLTVLPIVFTIFIALTNYSGPNNLPPAHIIKWVGLGTFKDLLLFKTWSATFFGILQWNLIWAVVATVTTYFGGILVALLINKKGIRFKKIWRTIFILPFAIPQLVSLLLMRNLFNGQFGPINQYLSYFGLGKVPWLSDPFWAKMTIILVNCWIGIPVSMILIMGVLTSIPADLYEAAEVDGASPYRKFRLITMPFVLFTTAPLLIMQFAGNINNFNVIFLLTNGNPVNGKYQFAGSTDLLVTWLYKLTLDNQKYNIAAVVGIIIFLILASLSIWRYRTTKSFKEEDMIQ
jgi:arabinogalactan oligomer / maltooligosaccharide transport system permease protein